MATGRRNWPFGREIATLFLSHPSSSTSSPPYRFTSLDSEQNTNYVHSSFHEEEIIMVRAVAEEALALASIALFLGMVAVWAQVLEMI
jgi:hypothetical protein